MLAQFQNHINKIQFGLSDTDFFSEPPIKPDVFFDKTFSTCVGGVYFHAFHELGETDDQMWVWVPSKKTVMAGDLVVYSFPNVGNPLKTQRYTLEWAEGLEAILAKDPEYLIPGHGRMIIGNDKIRETLMAISAVLRYVHDEVVKRLNTGMGYEDILHDVNIPTGMLENEYLAPRYGCPRFMIHGVLRQYSGWWDGNASNLFPPKKKEIAVEIVRVAGKDNMANHARRLIDSGNYQMALQFIDMLLASTLGTAEFRKLQQLKAGCLSKLGDTEPSLIARNIYYNGYRQAIKESEHQEPTP
jgi:alkyl sulfatase BDS1-like metallo-beta-lactamase superfamily hydrolase